MGLQASSQKTLDQIGDFWVPGPRPGLRAKHTCCGYLQTDHAGIALEMLQCKCASANLWIGGVADIFPLLVALSWRDEFSFDAAPFSSKGSLVK